MNAPAYPPPLIETERLLLRDFRAGDFPLYRDYYTGERTDGVGGPLPEERVFERFASMIGHWTLRGFGRYAIADAARPEGPAFGHVGPLQFGAEAPPEMTWTLWDAARTGQGYAAEAARAVLKDLFAKGWPSLIALIQPSNRASVRLAQRLGGLEDATRAAPRHFAGAKTFVLTPEGLA
ncbi:MAG: GNAT family N-acetyltransferase [Pseudomonadota bacterium]